MLRGLCPQAIFVSDTSNHRVCVLDSITGEVVTLAGVKGKGAYSDGAAAKARFSFPAGIAVDPGSGNVYVADGGNGVHQHMTLLTLC